MSRHPDERKYKKSFKKSSKEDDDHKLSVAPTASLKTSERRAPKTVTDANFALATDLYVDKGPQLSQIPKKLSSKSSLRSDEPSPRSNKGMPSKLSWKSDDHSPKGSSRSLATPTPRSGSKRGFSPWGSTNSLYSQYTDHTYASTAVSDDDPDRSPDYVFFADEYVKLSRGTTAYKVIKPEGRDESTPMRTIICLHGLTEASYIWEDMVEILSTSAEGPRAQVIVMDFYGHGRSPWSGFPCTLDIFVTQVQELLEVLNITEDGVDVLGYCMGEAVGVGFSVKFPHLCRSLCLVSPAGIRLKNPARYRILKKKFFGELTMMYRKSGMIREQLDLFYNTEFNTAHRPYIDKQMAMVAWQQKHTPGFLGSQLSLFRHFPLSGMSDLFAVSGRRTDRPVIVLWGNDDNIFPLRKALAVVENAFPTAQILAIMECGHNPIFEKIEDIAPPIIDFFKNEVTMY